MEMEIALSKVTEPQLFVTFFPIGLVCIAAGAIRESPLEPFTVTQHVVAEREQKMWISITACVTLSLLYQVL